MPLSTYLNLGLGELAHTRLTVELTDRTVKYPKGIAENVLVERMELDLEARLMGETLVLNRSLDPLNGDCIELNDLNEPLGLRRNQGDDLIPTIEDGALMSVPIFVGTFSVVTDFAVLEDMDGYRDEGMGYCTYQMVRSQRGLNLINEQCNKIPPLLKSLDYALKTILSVLAIRRMQAHDTAYVAKLTLDLATKEIDKVGEVSIIWNLICDCSHAGIQTHLQHTSLLINST
ncbi:hypothetical protein Tco_0157723 [Tanacetum coccineum]